MPASKRKAEDSKSSTRAPKAAKTAEAKDKLKKQPVVSAKAFKERAKALHVALTQVEGSSSTIGELDLVPTSFNTGSFGWKGSKKVTVQLSAPEGEEPSTVQVMLTINATVIGSKAAGGEETEESNEKEGKEE